MEVRTDREKWKRIDDMMSNCFVGVGCEEQVLGIHLQHIVNGACMENEQWALTQFDAQNGAAMQTLLQKHKVQVIQFPDEVLNALRKMADEVVEEEAAKTPMAKKVNADFKNFQKVVGTWGSASEKAYYDILQPKYSFKG